MAAQSGSRRAIGASVQSSVSAPWKHRQAHHREPAGPCADSFEGAPSMQQLLASIADAVLVTDGQGRVTTMNADAERLTGYTVAEACGQPLEEVLRTEKT